MDTQADRLDAPESATGYRQGPSSSRTVDNNDFGASIAPSDQHFFRLVTIRQEWQDVPPAAASPAKPVAHFVEQLSVEVLREVMGVQPSE